MTIRCQRTWRGIEGNAVDGWRCAHCDNHEHYVAISDPILLDYMNDARQSAIMQFGQPLYPHKSCILISGLRPECICDTKTGHSIIYIADYSDSLQARLQIGHEIFHHVCSKGRIFHWTHEMLACHFAIYCLRQCGFVDYADTCESNYTQEALLLTDEALFSLDLWQSVSHPPGFYGRAWLIGEHLERIVGWRRLCRLARAPLNSRRDPCLLAWSRQFPAPLQSEIKRILGVAFAGQVSGEPSR